ncbi:hypothetical protein TorRG33x02_001750 [Trema orientale]|uniref:Uncharacterized protein n=1 Tax=Trema orientale TaxID=63057 RepID=A0A2P5G1H6_TREOI|nr:hypothetical protein TorRG33x02_001750 [Trema orientale]
MCGQNNSLFIEKDSFGFGRGWGFHI